MARKAPHPKILDADQRVRSAEPVLSIGMAIPQMRWRQFDASQIIEEFSQLNTNNSADAKLLEHCRRQLRVACWNYCSRREATHEPADVRDLVDQARSSLGDLRSAMSGGGNDQAGKRFRLLVVRAISPPHGSSLRKVFAELRRLDAALNNVQAVLVLGGRPSDQLGNEFVASLVPIFRSLTRTVAIGRPTGRDELSPSDYENAELRLSSSQFGRFILAVERMIVRGIDAKLCQMHPEWSEAQRDRHAQLFRIQKKISAHTWARKNA
jgi:hypothetical protein